MEVLNFDIEVIRGKESAFYYEKPHLKLTLLTAGPLGYSDFKHVLIKELSKALETDTFKLLAPTIDFSTLEIINFRSQSEKSDNSFISTQIEAKIRF